MISWGLSRRSFRRQGAESARARGAFRISPCPHRASRQVSFPAHGLHPARAFGRANERRSQNDRVGCHAQTHAGVARPRLTMIGSVCVLASGRRRAFTHTDEKYHGFGDDAQGMLHFHPEYHSGRGRPDPGALWMKRGASRGGLDATLPSDKMCARFVC